MTCRSFCTAAMLMVVLLTGAWADSPGQDDLDKATDAKLRARTLRDLGEVIDLCQSALNKGLDKQAEAFARQMLASTLIQRGLVTARGIFENPRPDPAWPKIREVALADLERGAKLDPTQADAFLSIARLQLLPGGKRQRAIQALDQAVKAGADTPDVRARALVLRSGLAEDPKRRRADLDEAVRTAPGDPATYFSRAIFLADAGELGPALADLDKVIELKPTHAGAYEIKALVLKRQKKYDEALLNLDKAYELAPDSVYPVLERSRVHMLQRNTNAALHDLEQAAKIAPDDPNVMVLRAAVYQETGDKAKALAEIDRALAAKPNFGPALRARASLLAGEGKFSEAIAELERMRKEQPKDRLGLLQLGMLYAAENDPARAITTFSEVIGDDPDNFVALRGRGDAFLGVGKHAEAIADYEKALKIEPDDPSLLNNFAWVLATSPDDGIRSGRRAVELAEKAAKGTQYKAAHILSTLAAAHAETGDFKKAIEWSTKAVAAGTADQKEPLDKELASYRAGKPWRERQLPGSKPAAKPASSKK